MNDTIDPQDTPPTAPVLDAAARQALKARAHPLKPVVMIGESGLTPTVLAEIERALSSHELIKIRVFGDDRAVRAELLAAICAQTGSAPVQQIGKLLVVWRPAPEPQAESAARRKPNLPHHRKKAAGAGQAAPTRRSRAARPAGSGAAKRPAAPGARGKAAAGEKRSFGSGEKRSFGSGEKRSFGSGEKRSFGSGEKRSFAATDKRSPGAGPGRPATPGAKRPGAASGSARRAARPAGASAGPAPRPRTRRSGGR